MTIRSHPAASQRRRVPLLAAIAIAAAALLALLAFAPEADAGTYRAIQCHDGIGAGHADARFRATSTRYVGRARCDGPGLEVTHKAGSRRTPAGRHGSWTLTAPAGTEVVRIAARVAAAGEHSHSPQLHALARNGARRPIAGVRGRRHRVTWEGSARGLSARLTCAHRTSCGTGAGAYIHLRRIAFTLRDALTPRVEPGGSLLASASRRGLQSLRVTTADSGSGVRSVDVDVNGDPLLGRDLACHLSGSIALRLRPCPATENVRFDVATTAPGFRQGPNQVRVCAADYAPRARANRSCETARVRIDNLCPVSPSAARALAAHLVRRRGDRPDRVTGRLSDGSGGPVAGERVCVAARVRIPGQAERILATPLTDHRGRFGARLPAGPSREVRVAHWPSSDRPLERYLELRSRVVPRLRLRPARGLRNGERLRFRVRLPGPSNWRRRVVIQARSAARWVQVRAGRTNARGRWRGAYRFRSTTGTRRYAFRAFVPKQRGYPYKAGRSRIARRTVTGP